MNYEQYIHEVKRAAELLALAGHKNAQGAGIISLKLTFTSYDTDEHERTEITMHKNYQIEVVSLTEGTAHIDDEKVRDWEETIECPQENR